MISQARYVVIYKDDAHTRNRYFGPFITVSVAEAFLSTLPRPLPGGAKTWKTIEPYSHSEASLARDAILRNRELIATVFDVANST